MDRQSTLEACHFLDKTETAMLGGQGEFYPVYISVSSGIKNISVLSRIGHFMRPYMSDIESLVDKDLSSSGLMIEGFLTEGLMKRAKTEQVFPLTSLLEQELEIIKKAALREIELNGELTDNNFAWSYARYSSDIAEILDRMIKKEFFKELEQVFEKYVNSDSDQKAYKIANYFIHYINWNNSFKDIYERSFEIMPDDIKHIEKYFSPSLSAAVRAYLALLPSLNILRQAYSSRNDGKITNLTYIDWIGKIRNVACEIFIRYYGERQGTEYLDRLDDLLEKDNAKDIA